MSPHVLMMLLVLGDWPKAETFDGTNPQQRLDIQTEPSGYSVHWVDEEDRLDATITPQRLQQGKPFDMTLNIGVIEGAAFTGPVTVSIRPLASPDEEERPGPQQSTTVTFNKDRTWKATITPEQSGEHVIEVAWRTTSFKQARGLLTIEESAFNPSTGRALAALAILAALGIGLWQVFRKPPARASD